MNPYDICYGIPYGSARMLTLYIANPSLDICIIYIYIYTCMIFMTIYYTPRKSVV